jgi:hypothetical protein
MIAQLFEENNRPIDEKSPNLVTLLRFLSASSEAHARLSVDREQKPNFLLLLIIFRRLVLKIHRVFQFRITSKNT